MGAIEVQTIFLDLDGTLLDTSERHYQVYKDILSSKGIKRFLKKDFWRMKRSGIKTRDILPKHLPEETKNRFEEEWLEEIEKKNYLKYDKVFPGTMEVLSDLSKEYDLILVTLRNNIENLNWELSKLELKTYFNSIISGRVSKKNLVENYLLTNENIGKCLLVGDTEEEILTGQQLDIPTVSVTYGIRSEEFLKKFNPEYCIGNFEDIKRVKLIN